MCVSLYTSRIVLNVLGEEDFGIYSVVGGVVILLSFFNNSLITATQRFLNYEMGNKNAKIKMVFSTALQCHYLVAITIVIIAETLGFWFVKNYLVIPEPRMSAALWIYQFSILTFAISIIRSPYDAAIIAYEKMNVFAWFSIVDVILKLSIAFLLIAVSVDKLILYGFLLTIVSFLTYILYFTYCRRSFSDCRFIFAFDKKLFIGIFGFSGWMLSGTISNVLSTQGVNMLINIFFGPLHNAARGVAYQLYSAVNALVENVLVAVKPQIVQSFSQGNMTRVYDLVFLSSKASFFLLYLFAVPFLLQTNYILSLWLGKVPEYAVLFSQLMIIDLLISISNGPIASVTQASGKIRNYLLVISSGFLLTFLITYIFFKLGYPSYVTFVIAIVISFLGLFARLWISHKTVGFPVKMYLKNVFLKEIIVSCSILIPFLYVKSVDITFIHFIFLLVISSVSIITTAWFCGIKSDERKYIRNQIKNSTK